MAAKGDKPKKGDQAAVEKNPAAVNDQIHPRVFTIQSEIPPSKQSGLNRKSDETSRHNIQSNNRGHEVISNQPQSTHNVNGDKQSGARTGTSAASQQHFEHSPALSRTAAQNRQELHKKYVSQPQGPRETGAVNKVVTPRDKRVTGAREKVVPVKYSDKLNIPSSENTPGVSRLDTNEVKLHVMDNRPVNKTAVPNNPVTSKSRVPGNPNGHDNANRNDVSKQESRRLKVKERERARVARQNRRAAIRNDANVSNDKSASQSTATTSSQPLAVARTSRDEHVYRITVEDAYNAKKGKPNHSTVLFNVGERTMKRIARQMSKDKDKYVVEQLPKHVQPKTYFDLAVFTMCCCISPLGFVAVILSVLSDMSFRDGEMKKCRTYSKATLGLSITGIITTILVAIVVIVTQFYTPLNVKLYGGPTDDDNT